MSFLKILQAFGIPTVKENGHEIGCSCTHCRNESAAGIAATHDRRTRGIGGHTVMDAILDAREGRRLPVPEEEGDEPTR